MSKMPADFFPNDMKRLQEERIRLRKKIAALEEEKHDLERSLITEMHRAMYFKAMTEWYANK